MLPSLTAVYDTSQFQQFYTDAEEINSLMLNLLGSVQSLRVLEPCAGRGAFISGLTGEPSLVDAIDIDKQHIDYLNALGFSWLNTTHADFIDIFMLEGLIKNKGIRTDYDALICNPPYGLRFSIPYRQKIKRLYPHLYARESYGLFMYFGINALRKLGRYVFIIPDTFLTSRNHTPLRQFIINEARPTHIVRFPSKRFETVNFGYGNLCVIAGYREPLNENHKVFWIDGVAPETRISTELFLDNEQICGSFFKEHVSDGWVHPKKRAAITLDVPTTKLGDIADCKTGIYTGDNLRFCGFNKDNPPARATNGHAIDWQNKLNQEELSDIEKKEGICAPPYYVPFIRGGHRSPFATTSWALNWSKEAVQYYANDKKARLQNSQFYFRRGLAIPMVTSGKLSASVIEDAVFDQGVVGVFPHNQDLLDFLLIYLNSEFVSRTVKAALNPGANNSANYIKRIPIPIASNEQLKTAKEIIDMSRKKGWENTADLREHFITSLLNGYEFIFTIEDS
jgi:adenine-specific DNA-methyltransferase